MDAIIGRKLGMTQLFAEDGTLTPVTVIEAGPCPVVQVRPAREGVAARIQLGFGVAKAKRSTRAERGHAAKAGLVDAAEARAWHLKSAAILEKARLISQAQANDRRQTQPNGARRAA